MLIIRAFPSFVVGWILALYLGIGPIYWLPGVPPLVLLALKTSLFVGAVSIALFSSLFSRRFFFPGGGALLLPLIGFLALTLLASVGADYDTSFYRIQNAIQIIAFLFTCRFALVNRDALSIVRPAVRIFVTLSLISLIAIVVAPGLVNPFNSDLTVADTGFGGLRTGWSPANALFLPWVAVASILPGGVLVVGLAASTLIGNQVLVGGRAGILASAVIVFVGFLSKRKFVSVALAMATVVLAYVLLNTFADQLRLGKIGQGEGGFDVVNEASSGRLEQYVWALEVMGTSPFRGIGFGNQLHGGLGSGIHNDFLKLSVEGGVAYGVLGLAIVVWGLMRGWRMSFIHKGAGRAAFLTLVGGFVVAQFEPGFIYGNFNNSSFWWFCFCVCFTKISAEPDPRK